MWFNGVFSAHLFKYETAAVLNDLSDVHPWDTWKGFTEACVKYAIWSGKVSLKYEKLSYFYDYLILWRVSAWNYFKLFWSK